MSDHDADARLSAALAPIATQWPEGVERRAAVLAAIFAPAPTASGADAADALLFVVRAAGLRQHPGQIGFPGGSDAGDAAPAACALRETHEEIGVEPARVRLLGSLAPRRSSSGYLVHCLVGRVDGDRQLALQTGEVSRSLFVPLPALLRHERWQERVPPHAAGPPPLRPSPHFDWHGDVIWGLTGRFAHELVTLLRAH